MNAYYIIKDKNENLVLLKIEQCSIDNRTKSKKRRNIDYSRNSVKKRRPFLAPEGFFILSTAILYLYCSNNSSTGSNGGKK